MHSRAGSASATDTFRAQVDDDEGQGGEGVVVAPPACFAVLGSEVIDERGVARRFVTTSRMRGFEIVSEPQCDVANPLAR